MREQIEKKRPDKAACGIAAVMVAYVIVLIVMLMTDIVQADSLMRALTGK